MVGDPIEERTVVAGDDERAGPVVEERLERPQRVEVEVVGRLVEDQQVRLGRQHHHQLQPSPLATRQHPHRRVLGGRVEPEPLEQRPVTVVGFPMRSGDQLPDDGVLVEVGRVLVGEADDHGLAALHRARPRAACGRR